MYDYDVIVIGAGHAGVEAALASARLGCRTAVLTINLDNVALMPCNCSVGGPAKGHVVREVDALGGAMALATDKTLTHIRMLNTGKGPAVQALRAQCDKKMYQSVMKATLEAAPNVDYKQAMVEALLVEDGQILGLRTQTGVEMRARAVVVTTGTFLRGLVHIGDVRDSRRARRRVPVRRPLRQPARSRLPDRPSEDRHDAARGQAHSGFFQDRAAGERAGRAAILADERRRHGSRPPALVADLHQ